MELKVCKRCQQSKSAEEFYEQRIGSGKLCSYCKVCSRTAALKWWKTHRKQAAITTKKRLPRLRIQKLRYQKQRMQEIKLRVFTHYSHGTPKCAACGVQHFEFLTIDHVNGGGSKWREKVVLGGANTYQWLDKHEYPEGFAVLCYNCNCAKDRKVDPLKEITSSTRVYRETKMRVMAYYSHGTPKCECCGETKLELLNMDHIGGGGNKHRKSTASAKNVYWWLDKNGYPEGYRVLCYNCNCSISYSKYCPHQILGECGSLK